MVKLDELIASQSGFDEEALVADLKQGVMKISSFYEILSNGEVLEDSIVGSHYYGEKVVFYEDGTCWDCFSYWYSSLSLAPMNEPVHLQYKWRYDPATQSLITDRYHSNENSAAKVLYYNAEDHRLIMEGCFLAL